jgi:FixJ family two-component response regulator
VLGCGLKGADVTEVKRRTVAIVDGDDAVLDSFRLLLEVAGRPAQVFTSAAYFPQANVRYFGCIILDYHMPHMTGLQLVERLHADGSGIPIMPVTGSPSPAILARAAELGIERILENLLVTMI